MAAASSTDVRAWAREQGHEVGSRGALPAELIEEYERAHASGPRVVQGTLEPESHPYPEDPAMGVTAADFPPEDDPGDTGGQETPVHRSVRERRPRTVKPGKPRRFSERIFGGAKAGAGKNAGRARHARQDLSDFAEETWSDLAWLAEPVLPPLARMLTIQAPYAGTVFDGAVKGTPLDSLLQPAARYAGSLRALNGLAGPPVYVAMICMSGRREQAMHRDGTPVTLPDGSPVMVYDARTRMMFAGLRYSLLQMTKIADVHAEQIRERTATMSARTAAVDAMIESIFGMAPEPDDFPPEPGAAPPGPAGANGYSYPDDPVMDGTGMDPGRL